MMKAILVFLWQLPQNLLGLLLWAGAKLSGKCAFAVPKTNKDDAVMIYVTGFPGAVTLGQYIVLGVKYIDYDGTTERHERGHARQSCWLGPLYLLAIGLPSLIHAALWRPGKGSYYDFYTERWADHIAGIKREEGV